MFFKIGAVKDFANFTGKTPAFVPATLLERDFNTGVFL